jgi:hypothetical protein
VTRDSTTVDAVLQRALEAYAALAEIEDEWTYVNDLSDAWRERIETVATAAQGRRIDPAAAAAIEGAIGEIARIADRHRAIDWLSTYPQVVLLALGERP